MGPTGAGHYVKMVHNGDRVRDDAGLRRGLRPVRQVRVRARQREDRAPVDAGLGRALVAVRAGGAARSSRRATTSRELERLHRRTPARAAGRSRTRSTSGRPDAGHHRRRCYARFYVARQRRLRRPRCTPRCATSSAATRCKKAGRRMTDDAPAPENPLVEGLERLPVHPTTLVDLRRDGRPGQAQAAAGALQPRPRGRAARALQPRSACSRSDMPHEDFRQLASEAINAVLAPRARREGARRAARATSATCRARSTTRRVYDDARRDARRVRRGGRRAAEPRASTSRPRRSSSR